MLTQSRIKKEIEELLGRGRRGIEIQNEGFTAAVNRSLRMFKRHIVGRRYKVSENVPDKGFIDVTVGDASDDPLPLGVLDVKFLDEAEEFISTETFDVFAHHNYRSRRYGFVLLEKIDYENRQRILGTEPDFHYDVTNHRLFIYTAGDNLANVGYVVAYPLENLSLLPVPYEQLFMDCVEGHIRKSLGDIRGKFNNVVPGPTGDITLDGDKQFSEGKEILTRVREDLANIQEPVPPIWG